ncbi:MAG: Bifunctional protein Aas [Candidatus Anoxychlamydiales bacterium]|nr:Bifunctional protein Aas [Candidatus Anoxychlamydiales bacterium]
MRYLLLSLLCLIGRGLIKLRYSVKIKGKNLLKKHKFNPNSGILFLPNHPAHIDPILIALYFWPKFKMRPIVIEYIFRQSGIGFLMRLVKALSIPNFDTALNEVKLKKARELIAEIIDGVNKKENFLLYPAGRLKHTGKELLGGSSATHSILSQCKGANIVLIRTTGLWGSSFSRAYTGRTPDFKGMVKRGMKCLLNSFVFFMPRRKVLVEIEIAKEDFPINGTRLEINRYLENWYNRYPTEEGVKDAEPPSLVSYSPFKEKLLKLPKTEARKTLTLRDFSSELEKDIFSELAKLSKISEDQINPKMDLAQDLGLDSLDVAELITFLGVNYDVGAIYPEDILTVQDVLEVAEGTKKNVRKELQEELVFKFSDEKKRKKPFPPQGKTIQESFLCVCSIMKDSDAIADDLIGPMSYKRLKIAALVLAEEIKKYPSKHIAILLPASCGSYLVILATLFANKIPVMLNWTLGPRYLNHMMQVTHSENVISSWKFLEKLSNVEFGHLSKKLVYLEDIKKRITKFNKLSALLKTFSTTKGLLRKLDLDKISENDTACILFTSGTEAEPKGVPLSHKNILSNQRAAMKCIDLHAEDIIYGILPPFHSFGFSIAGLFPILSGVKIAFYPDPTDSYSLAGGIERWKITVICSPPSFLKGLIQAAKQDQLKTIRMFVTGAEKTPKALYEKIKNLGENKHLVEGYGITECAPSISINIEGIREKGVGKPLENVELCFIDPEKETLVEKGNEGEICVKGPNVFSGYLDAKKDPFIEIDHEKWYKTGDLGYLDEEGNLILSGRLKRFTKVAGEMVSLGGIEEVITEEIITRTNIEPDGPLVVAIAIESDGSRPKLVLFTTTELSKNEANQILKEAGFSNLVKIFDVKKMDGIPLLGTGKIDYRFLQTIIE